MRLARLAALVILSSALGAGATASELRVRADQTPGTPAQVAQGERLFETCAQCHGPEGEGRLGKAPRLHEDGYLAVVGNDYLYQTIRQGRPGTDMISWGTWLSQDETRALVAYIRSWQEHESVELDESPLRGDPAKGGEIFAARCATCHGANALGYAEGGQGLGIGRFWFLEQASNGMIRAIVMRGKPGTPMPAFGHAGAHSPTPLTLEEVDSVIQWLRANPR